MNEPTQQQPFLSLAIPVYNQAATIRATVESALEAFRGEIDVEIVVSENHSTDGTAELLSAFADKVKIVRPPSHLRMAENWNFAVDSCSGKWVGMLSGDDKILPGYVASIRSVIANRDSAVFAYGGWMNVDASSGAVSRRTVMSMPPIASPKKTVKSLLRGPKASFASYCFLKTAFKKVGGFPDEYNLIQDWIFQFKLGFLGDFVKTDSIIAEYLVGHDRNELEFQRVPLYISDFVRFCCEDMWLSADMAITKRTLLNVCELRASYCEALLDRYPHWRDKGDALLSPLYELIGRERVSINRKKYNRPYFAYAISIVRKFLQALF